MALSAPSPGSATEITIPEPVADPGFSRGGHEPSRGGVNTPNFPENCMKSKEFGCPGGGACVPHAPPRSANGNRCRNLVVYQSVSANITHLWNN